MAAVPTSCALPTTFAIALPDWVAAWQADLPDCFPAQSARVDLAIELSRMNVEQGSGGPFGAALFDRADHRLVAVGVNLVVTSHCSLAHAEMVALSMAQAALGCFDLAQASDAGFELVSSCEPCAMCAGAIPWSGVNRLVSAACDADARAIGFDEGAKPTDWQAALRARGIAVASGLQRAAAVAVLRDYAARQGAIYNGGAV